MFSLHPAKISVAATCDNCLLPFCHTPLERHHCLIGNERQQLGHLFTSALNRVLAAPLVHHVLRSPAMLVASGLFASACLYIVGTQTGQTSLQMQFSEPLTRGE